MEDGGGSFGRKVNNVNASRINPSIQRLTACYSVLAGCFEVYVLVPSCGLVGEAKGTGFVLRIYICWSEDIFQNIGCMTCRNL